jgi:hypothetical protein
MPYSCKVQIGVKDNTIIKIGDEKILTKKWTANEKSSETGYLKLKKPMKLQKMATK